MAVSTRVYAPNLRNSKDAVGSYTNVNIFEALTALTFGTDDNLSAAGFSDRLDSVALALGLNPKTVRSDYNNVKKPTLENIRAVISGELLQKYGIMPGSFKALQNQRKTPVDLATLLANLERIKAIVDPIVASLAEQIAGVKDPTEIIREMVDSSKYLDAAFVSLASGNGDNFMCGVTGAGTVKCWGQGSWGNLGNGTWYEDALSKNGQDAATQSETAAATDPATLPGMYTHEPQTVTRADGTPLTGVAMVETGLRYACAVTVTGEVWCWGDNSLGQLGQGSDSIDLERPAVPVASQVIKGRQNGDGKYFANAVNLYLANDTACARTADNELYCWGDNTVMQTGDRRPDDEVTEPYKALIDSESVSAEDMAIAAVPHPVLVMDHVVDVSAGDDSFYAVTDGKEADTESQMINDEERLYALLGWGPFRRSNLYGWGADPASLRTDVSDLLPRNESGQVDYKEAEDFRQRYNLITHLNNQWGDRYHQTPEPMDGDGWTCYGEDGKKYTSPDDIRLIADAHYNSEQTDPDANYKNTYNNKDQLENTHFGKQWLVPTMKLTSPRPVIVTTVKLNFSGKKNIGGAMGTYMTAAPESLYKSLCDDKTQNCYLDKFRFTGVHVGHIYDRFPIGALQLTPDAVGNRDAVVTVSFEDSSGATRFVTLKQGFTKKMLTCTKTVGNTGQDSEVKRDVVIRKAVPALYYPNNYNSGAEGGMVLKDCRHPNEKGSSWGDECADATKIKGFLPSQDKAREVTRTVSGEEVKVSEEPQVGHPKKGEYTLQKMSPKDAKKICAEHYDKKKDYEGYLKCQLALRGSVKYQGYNPFGQAGKAPSKVNANAAPQAVGVTQYPEGSYAAYESAWSYIINDLNLQRLEYESDDVREQETARLTEELRKYMGTYNNGYMWATKGCGGSAVVDNYWLVGLGNNFSCKMTQGGISTGNALVNSVLLNTAFYDATPEDKYKDFSGMEPGDLPANRIAGSSTICADAKVCPEIVYDADDEDSGEGRE
ncbi:RCC1 domain-containing protein [Succinimonas amylolytica]|uniref:RCC1 domain-containing protein n=1 Tax=Succinimonas amylolytica TaxID=83769 RepID=UPI0012FC7282|nr:hypothetical protein [Succinimonas amylolytica]